MGGRKEGREGRVRRRKEVREGGKEEGRKSFGVTRERGRMKGVCGCEKRKNRDGGLKAERNGGR